MWAHLPDWLVDDGLLEEPRVGQLLEGVGLRAECARLRSAGGPAVLAPIAGPTHHPAPPYAVTGSVTWSAEPASLLVDAEDLQVLVEPCAAREVTLAPSGARGLERFLPEFWMPDLGTWVRADCTLAVVPEVEWVALGFPDARSDWTIARTRPLTAHDTAVCPGYLVDLVHPA
ncbi:MAG: hypothetical protein LOY01_13790 [Brachybacterium paraconglomeratum]|nr:hypothetical protein [Brachybacterium paraconglomeratum]